MKNEQERMSEWVTRLRTKWRQNPNISTFIQDVAFSLTLRDVDIANYAERDREAWKELKHKK